VPVRRRLFGRVVGYFVMLSVAVAIINDNPETLATLRDVLQREHHHVVTSQTRDVHGVETDFLTFMTEHDPGVVIWDIARFGMPGIGCVSPRCGPPALGWTGRRLDHHP
jgi:hypothetical protein